MRDQGSSSKNVPAIDFCHIDEKTSLGPEDLNRIVNTIVTPSTEIIDPTFATGLNTKTFISLCEKMEAETKEDFKAAIKDLQDAAKALNSIHTIAEALDKSTERTKHDTAYNMVLKQIRDAERTKLRVTNQYSDAMKEFGAAVRTMIKLGAGLLADQEEHGASIKTGKSGIKYAFTCKAVDGQWKGLKGAFAEVKKLGRVVKSLKEYRETEKVVFLDTENEDRPVLGGSIAEISEEISNLPGMAKREVEGEES